MDHVIEVGTAKLALKTKILVAKVTKKVVTPYVCKHKLLHILVSKFQFTQTGKETAVAPPATLNSIPSYTDSPVCNTLPLKSFYRGCVMSTQGA